MGFKTLALSRNNLHHLQAEIIINEAQHFRDYHTNQRQKFNYLCSKKKTNER